MQTHLAIEIAERPESSNSKPNSKGDVEFGIPLKEVLNPTFIRRTTCFPNLETLLMRSGYMPHQWETHAEGMNRFIASVSIYPTWNAMLLAALDRFEREQRVAVC